MNEELNIPYYNLINLVEKVINPFSRETITEQIKSEFGKGFLIWHNLGNGIATSANNYTLNKDYIISLESDVPGAVIIFNLGEDIIYRFKDGKKYELKKNRFFVGFSSDEFVVQMLLKKELNYNNLTIGIKEELFLRLTNNFEILKEKMEEAKEKNYSILDGSEIDPDQLEMLSSFKEKIVDKNLLNQLYFESKTTNLIHYTINKLQKIINASSTLDTKKIDSLERAKQIILTEYSSSLSIKEIAYKSAINECYLKKDFKSYYGMTIYEMLQRHRMEMAKNFLKENYSVKETALKVGYKHIGNFSKLFTSYFNTTPSNYKKELEN
ncbi:AraC family transcriptional regulator [Halarcobacter ebronensis]|uniref:AraC family transcriptional regulator n=1 Tax=Halarcobacter ebronensis TaxID=1462615 RepID=A0A4Q0YIJ2_9BACT|nr:AraC family transcriptional regulator [Halarcobacter ebronensis]RXJ68909.1 AraC family transcriptional regulator [Halarcobacter ebronensis]